MKRSALAVGLVTAAHAAVFACLFPFSGMLRGEPIVENDFPFHWYLAHALQPFLRAGRLWGWDPLMLAGWPAGLFSGSSSLLFAVAGVALSPLLSVGLAMNLVVALLYLAAPWLGFATARRAGLGPGESALASVLLMVMWHTDSTLRWAWLGGMSAWAFTTALAPLVAIRIALLARAPGSRAVAATSALALLFVMTHLVGPVLLVAPAAVGLAAALSTRSRGRALGALVVAGVVPLGVLALRARPMAALPEHHSAHPLFLQSRIGLLPRDLLLLSRRDEYHRPRHEMVGNPLRKSTAARDLLLIAGAIGVAGWWRSGRRLEAASLGGGAVAGLAVGYLAPALFASAGMLEPYRFAAAAPAFLAAPAASGIARLLRERGSGSVGAKVRLGLVAAAAIATLVEAVTRVVPDLRERPRLLVFSEAPGFRRIRDEIRRLPPGGRIIVDNALLAPIVALDLGRPVLGGPGDQYRFEIQDEANAVHLFFGGIQRHTPDVEEARGFLARYGVSFVVTTFDDMRAVWGPGGLDLPVHAVVRDRLADDHIASVAVIYEVPEPAPLILGGGAGAWVRAGANRIEVETGGARDLVLRFHWLPTLRATPPGVRVEPVLVDETQTAAFVRLVNPGGAERVVIENVYTRLP